MGLGNPQHHHHPPPPPPPPGLSAEGSLLIKTSQDVTRKAMLNDDRMTTVQRRNVQHSEGDDVFYCSNRVERKHHLSSLRHIKRDSHCNATSPQSKRKLHSVCLCVTQIRHLHTASAAVYVTYKHAYAFNHSHIPDSRYCS